MTTATATRKPARRKANSVEHVDVLVVGAGLSGIGLGHYLTTRLPGKSFVMLDMRERIGGTWDLFRYPGIRSDSDLHTYAYEFKPWDRDYAIADADEIMDYLGEVVAEDGLADHIRFGYKVLGADWSSQTGRWTVRVEDVATGKVTEMTCGLLFSAAGYYDYDEGNAPHFEGSEDFGGQIVHPQFWPENLNYEGKQVVVIGSGATAVTLVPAMADQGAGHVTMLQRSPTYAIPLPGKDPAGLALRKVLPDQVAYRLTRQLNIGRQRLIWEMSQRHPTVTRRIIRAVNKALLPKGYDVDVHFKPRYNPWDERLCCVRDGDMFKAIRDGRASVVTDHIDQFTEHGIKLKSGAEIPADIIVTATGLKLKLIGGMELSLDGEPVDPADSLVYKSFMLSGVPNFAMAVGYTNSSWTLKLDLVYKHLCRMLTLMDAKGYDTVVPVADDPTIERRPLLDFHAGYVQRAVDQFPKQGSHGPWTVPMSYAVDKKRLRRGPVEDPALRFGAVSSKRLRAVAG